MKKILITLILSIIMLLSLTGCGIVMDVAGRYYNGALRGIESNIEHRVFKNSTSYVDGAADDLAKYYYEFNTATDTVTKKGLVNVIVQRFANLDPKKIEDSELRSFLTDCKNGSIMMKIGTAEAVTAPASEETTTKTEFNVNDILGGN